MTFNYGKPQQIFHPPSISVLKPNTAPIPNVNNQLNNNNNNNGNIPLINPLQTNPININIPASPGIMYTISPSPSPSPSTSQIIPRNSSQ